MECQKDSNKEICACSAAEGERRGICRDCLRHHLSAKSLPLRMRNLDWIQTTA